MVCTYKVFLRFPLESGKHCIFLDPHEFHILIEVVLAGGHKLDGHGEDIVALEVDTNFVLVDLELAIHAW